MKSCILFDFLILAIKRGKMVKNVNIYLAPCFFERFFKNFENFIVKSTKHRFSPAFFLVKMLIQPPKIYSEKLKIRKKYSQITHF